MKIEKLQDGYYQFGNKGAVFTNSTHIAKTGSFGETLCQTPMLSNNWANIEKHPTIGCQKCLEIYGKPNDEEWKLILNSMKHYIGVRIIIPERFGDFFIEHFTNCLPPIFWSNNYVLCSEPYNYEEETNLNRYTGFYKKHGIYYGIITTVDKFKTILELTQMISNPINAIQNYNYFCLNFNSSFINKCWADEPEKINHLTEKFSEIYSRKGTSVMIFFMSELDYKNQKKLSKWINENYCGFSHFQDDYVNNDSNF